MVLLIGTTNLSTCKEDKINVDVLRGVHCKATKLHIVSLFVTSYVTHVHRCGDALSINKALIQEEQLEYQREMERKYHDFKELLAPLTKTGMKLLPRKTR